MEINKQKNVINDLEEQVKTLSSSASATACTSENTGVKVDSSEFGVEAVRNRETKLKNLFNFYTGLTYLRFMALLTFLLQNNANCPNYSEKRRDLHSLSVENGLFLTLCRLRRNFALKDIAMRFDLSVQSAGIAFSAWIEIMGNKLSSMCMWPHRDTIIQNMPTQFKTDFPNTLIIIDATELKTHAPWAHSVQSQMYSEYKSSTTFKGLVGCDPSGSLIFVSKLFTGSISDKKLSENSGFYEEIQRLKGVGYIVDGDCVMADKGFTIHAELKDHGMALNIPPFGATGCQMSQADLGLTDKIARHRIHIERLIARIKDFKMLNNRIPANLFKTMNQIWNVCCHLTLFQDFLIKKK